jgi:hypothetical protein
MDAWTRRARGAVLVATCGLVVSCTSGPGSDSEPKLGPLRAVKAPADVTLPLDADRLSQREYLTVQRAAWRLTRDCVRRFGGEYTVPESAVVANLPQLEHDNERRYGLLDGDSAAARGYNVAPDQLPPPVDRSTAWNPTDAEKLLVRGASGGVADVPKDVAGNPLPSGGCQGEADRKLSDGAKSPPNEHLGEQLSLETFQRSGNDSRVHAAMAKWSACMKSAGYSYQTIWDPNDKKWPDPAGQEEIATAKADVACKVESNLAAIWMQVETAYQKRKLEERAQELELAQQFARTTARNAARVVGGA